MGDQERISPYNINTISTRQLLRIKENINCIVDSKGNYKFDLGVKGLMDNGPANPYSHEKIIFLNLDLPEKPMITKLIDIKR